MKYNLIYFDNNQLEDYFFNEDYRKAYDEFLIPFEGFIYLWTGRETDFYFICVDINRNLIPIEKTQVNKIWIRGKNFDYEKYKDFNVINTQIVEEIADDKNETYGYLKDLMPKSDLVEYNNYDDSAYFNDGRIAYIYDKTFKYPCLIKPLDELKGNGIKKLNNYTELINHLYLNSNRQLIIQEFIECIDYEPLDIKGTHDIRLIIVNSEIVGLAVRQPKEGGWLCNIAQGGSIKVYDKTDLIEELMKDSSKSMLKIEQFKNQVIELLPEDFKQAIFSIDFCNTKDGFKIFELNSYPGIRLEYKTYINKVKELLND